MGQQQLLLLVFGIVIVGIAVIVGINAYSENAVNTNSDALFQSALRIASEAQTWKAKPQLLSGSPDATKHSVSDFSSLTFYSLGFTSTSVVDEDCYKNLDGEFALFPSNRGLGILATNVARQNRLGIAVTGSRDTDIQLYEADWNPVKGGSTPNGSEVNVRSHQRCHGPGNTPMDVGSQ